MHRRSDRPAPGRNAITGASRAGAPLFLAFRLADRLFALPIEEVEEVFSLLPIEPVLAGPPWLKGVILVRGRLIAVIDAAAQLGLRRERPAPEDSHLVAIGDGSGRRAALEVDEVIGLEDLASAAAWEPEEIDAPGPVARVADLDGSVYRILDPARLLERVPDEGPELPGAAA